MAKSHLFALNMFLTKKPFAFWAGPLTFLSMMLGLMCATGEHTQTDADFTKTLQLYFESILLPQVVVMIFWSFSALGLKAHRRGEYELLLALPILPQRILERFLVTDFKESVWVPVALSLLAAGLLSHTSLNYFLRQVVFSFVMFAFAITFTAGVHLLSDKWNRLQGHHYFGKYSSAVVINVAVSFQLSLILVTAAMNEISTFMFGAAMLLALLMTGLTMAHAKRLFVELHRRSHWLRRGAGRRWQRRSHPFLLRLFKRIVTTNPLLAKNVTAGSRSKSPLSFVGLSYAFLFVSYWMAMNNSKAEDVLTVMLAMVIGYIYLTTAQVMRDLNPALEPPKILHVLPITGSQLYMSALLPKAVWLFGVVTAVSAWFLLEGFAFSAIASFWLSACLAIVVLLPIAVNCTVGNYPNEELTKTRYLLWNLGLIVILAVFYKYHNYVALGVMVLSFIETTKLRFWGPYLIKKKRTLFI